MTGIFKRPLDTWSKSKGFQTQITRQIRGQLEEGIARDFNTGVERTMGYSENLEALREEFGMGLEEADSQFIQYPQAVRKIYVARLTRRPGPSRAQQYSNKLTIISMWQQCKVSR